MKARIYFLDNLRTFMIFLVIVLHAGLVYESVLENAWIVSDPAKNNSIGLIRMYLDLFVMFTLFFVSGYFIPHSIKGKTSWNFLTSKFKRIMLPWLIAVFTLIPAYKVIFLYSRGLPQEVWYSYFHVFERAGTNLSFFANNPTQNWLWFLPVLFLFQVVYLILDKNGFLPKNMSVKSGVIWVFATGLVYSMVIFLAGLTGWYSGPVFDFQRERLVVYFMVFLLGALCATHRVFDSREKNKKLYIWANVVLTLGLGVFTVVALNLFFNLVDPARNFYFVSPTVDRLIYYVSMLLSMLSFLYIWIHTFRFTFNKASRLMQELNKNSYSVYIIHLIVIGVLAYFMVDLAMPAFVKYVVLTILTFVVSNVLVSGYRWLVQVVVKVRVAPHEKIGIDHPV